MLTLNKAKENSMFAYFDNDTTAIENTCSSITDK